MRMEAALLASQCNVVLYLVWVWFEIDTKHQWMLFPPKWVPWHSPGSLSLASYVTNATGAVREHWAIVRCWPIKSQDVSTLTNHMTEKYKHDLGKVQLSGSKFPSLNYVLVLRLSSEQGHSYCRCATLRSIQMKTARFLGCWPGILHVHDD